jgi:hypothetical protein
MSSRKHSLGAGSFVDPFILIFFEELGDYRIKLMYFSLMLWCLTFSEMFLDGLWDTYSVGAQSKMVLIILTSTISISPRKNAIAKTRDTTIAVEANNSLRVGHFTFLNSILHSLRN